MNANSTNERKVKNYREAGRAVLFPLPPTPLTSERHRRNNTFNYLLSLDILEYHPQHLPLLSFHQKNSIQPLFPDVVRR